MINGNESVSEKYDELSEYLLANIDHENIDKVAVRSLIGVCAEFEGTEISKNSMIFPNPIRHGESISVKFSNIKFSLRLAFDSILLSPSDFMNDKGDIIRFIIKVIKLANSEMSIHLDTDMTTVLKAVYMLSYDNHGACMEKLTDYASQNGIEQEKVKEIISDLESIKCVTMENGDYKLAETIILNF